MTLSGWFLQIRQDKFVFWRFWPPGISQFCNFALKFRLFVNPEFSEFWNSNFSIKTTEKSIFFYPRGYNWPKVPNLTDKIFWCIPRISGIRQNRKFRQSWTKIIGTNWNLCKKSKFQSGQKPRIWVSNSSDTEIRNPTNSLGTRLLEMSGFNDLARRPKILSPKS